MGENGILWEYRTLLIKAKINMQEMRLELEPNRLRISMATELISEMRRFALDTANAACYNSTVIRRESLIKVTWKRYSNDTVPQERVFEQYSAAERFFWFLHKQSWAASPALTVEG